MHPVIKAWWMWDTARWHAARRPRGRSPGVQAMLERAVVRYREHLNWLLSFYPE